MTTDHIPGKNGGRLRRIPKGTSGNPKGRPRKGVSAVLSALEAAGHDEVTAEQVRATMGRMLNLPRAELLNLAKDETKTPIMDALIARALAGKDGWSALNDMLDRVHGKPKMSHEHTGKDGAPLVPPPINVVRKP